MVPRCFFFKGSLQLPTTAAYAVQRVVALYPVRPEYDADDRSISIIGLYIQNGSHAE